MRLLVGEVDAVFVTHDWAKDKTGAFLDLMLVGHVDQAFMHELIQKVESH